MSIFDCTGCKERQEKINAYIRDLRMRLRPQLPQSQALTNQNPSASQDAPTSRITSNNKENDNGTDSAKTS